MESKQKKRPPFVLWLVIGLPLASMVAGIGLVIVAIRSGGADVVTDDVRRVSQIQTTDLSADQMATRLKLSAVIRIEEGSIDVLPVNGPFTTNAPLRLAVRHPTRADEDRNYDLEPVAAGWHADAQVDNSHDWILELSSPDGVWRLHGRMPKQQHAAHVGPSMPTR